MHPTFCSRLCCRDSAWASLEMLDHLPSMSVFVEYCLLTSYNMKPFSFIKFIYCDTMLSHSFPFVLAPLRRSLCLFWRETHTKDWELDPPQYRKRRRERRSQRRQWESQLTKKGRRDQPAWDSCPENETVGRGRQWQDGGRAEKRAYRSQIDDC